jgi:hypothetical protein
MLPNRQMPTNVPSEGSARVYMSDLPVEDPSVSTNSPKTIEPVPLAQATGGGLSNEWAARLPYFFSTSAASSGCVHVVSLSEPHSPSKNGVRNLHRLLRRGPDSTSRFACLRTLRTRRSDQ